MPARLVICTVIVPLSPGVPAGVAPVGTRVSTRRLGGMAVKIDAPAGAAAGSSGAADAWVTTVASPDVSRAAANAARANVRRFIARMAPMLAWRLPVARDRSPDVEVRAHLGRHPSLDEHGHGEQQDPAPDGGRRETMASGAVARKYTAGMTDRMRCQRRDAASGNSRNSPSR